MPTVLDMAREAGLYFNEEFGPPHDHHMAALEKFAELVRQDERSRMPVTVLHVPSTIEKSSIQPGERALIRSAHQGYPSPPDAA